MRSRSLLAFVIAGSFAVAAAVIPGCNCDKNPTRNQNGDMGVPTIGSITIDPSDVTLDLTQGQPPPTQPFTVTYHPSSGDKDVTGQSTFTLADMTLGSMSANVFTAGTAHGGTTALFATYIDPSGQQQQATAMIHVRVKATFNGPDCPAAGCPAFPGDNAPQCTQTNVTPQIYYPPDGVLLPPNMEKMAVQWTPFPGGPPAVPITEFEIDFQNANTDVRILTTCANQLFDSYRTSTVTTGRATGGCSLELSDIMSTNVWDFIAKSNRGGDPVKVTVRATTDGMCATPSTNSVSIAFAEQDLNGGLFYWKSTVGAIGTGVGGQIWAKSFGDVGVPEEQMTGPGTGGNLTAGCHGCHSLSRDGKYMVLNFDDDDSDDEYSDVKSALVDVKAKNAFLPPPGTNTSEKIGLPPGFQTLNPDHSLFLGTNGLGTGTTNMLYLWDGTSTNGGAATPPTVMPVGPAGGRPTMIDWSADGTSVLFVLPSKIGTWNGHIDDDHLFGGSIYALPYDTTAKTFGTATAIITSQGENNYYPSYSPDGAFIVFNRVPLIGTMQTIDTCTPTTAMMQSCPNDSFSNPKARVWLLSTKAGSMPVDAENANGSPAASPVDVSNSWPRWSPFIQQYKGDKLLWVTFSSTRDYGLRVRNHVAGMIQCYPSDSLEDPLGSHGTPFPDGCIQPQIWMAAINLSHLEFNSTDPSFTAFYLPFQADVDAKNNSTHNHTAQWTETVVTQPQPDMGNCIASGGACSPTGTPCCSGFCTNNVCGIQ